MEEIEKKKEETEAQPKRSGVGPFMPGLFRTTTSPAIHTHCYADSAGPALQASSTKQWRSWGESAGRGSGRVSGRDGLSAWKRRAGSETTIASRNAALRAPRASDLQFLLQHYSHRPRSTTAAPLRYPSNQYALRSTAARVRMEDGGEEE